MDSKLIGNGHEREQTYPYSLARCGHVVLSDELVAPVAQGPPHANNEFPGPPGIVSPFSYIAICVE